MSYPAQRILVIDDSRDFLEFMEALLSAEGFQVLTAHSDEQMRVQLATRQPDLIISDVRMPGMEPFSVLALLAADEKLRDTPVLFCTGAVQEVEDAADLLLRPRTDVLAKPFDIDVLLAAIDRLSRPRDPG